MKAQALFVLVHHRQADAALRIRLAPPVERRHRIEFTLDRPIGGDAQLLARHQPDPQHPLQLLGQGQAAGQVQPLLDQPVPQRAAFGQCGV